MNHIHIIIQTLILFFSFALSAKTVCVLTEKNVDQRRYSFRCNDKTVKVQCKSKDEDEDICGVTIKSAIETMKFSISEDELDSFNLFSSSDLTKTECDSSKKLCKLDNNVCKKYEEYYGKLKEKFIGDFNISGRCAGGSLGTSIQGLGALSGGIVSDTEFRKNNCSVMSGVASEALKNKVSIFAKILDAPILDRTSFLYGCVKASGQNTASNQDAEVLKKVPALLELKKVMLSNLGSSEHLKGLVCSSQSEIFFDGDKLNVNNVICAVIEESKVSLSDKTISCDQTRSGVGSDRFSDARTAREASAALAKADSIPLEQKPMPEIMASQVGKPIGLTPALAQVDQVAPGSGTAQGITPSESNIAEGAVRNTIPTAAAFEAGKAFAPVFDKL